MPLPISSSIVLTLCIDDWSTKHNVGRGVQDFSWLAQTACVMYSRYRRGSLFHSNGTAALLDEFFPINCTNDKGNILQPTARIFEQCLSGSTIIIQVQRIQKSVPLSLTQPQPRSSWLLLHKASPSFTLPVMIELDIRNGPIIRDKENSDPPFLVCSLSRWAKLHPLKPVKHGQWRITINLPVGCEFCFAFVVNQSIHTSSNYEIRYDSQGQSLNYIHVTQEPPRFEELNGDRRFHLSKRPWPSTKLQKGVRFDKTSMQSINQSSNQSHQSRINSSVFVASQLVTDRDQSTDAPLPEAITGRLMGLTDSLLSQLGCFAFNSQNPATAATVSGNFVNSQLQLQEIETVYESINVRDVMDDTDEKRSSLRELIIRSHPSLRSIFDQYTDPVIVPARMDSLTFLSFARICRIIDRRVTAQRCQRIFELALSQRTKTIQPSESISVQIKQANDKFTPDGKPISHYESMFDSSSCIDYAGFLSCLIRMAVLKWKPLSGQPAQALETLLTRHVLPFSSLLFLPSPLHGARQVGQAGQSTSATQEREREKERVKEKLLYTALIDSAVKRDMQAREEDVVALFEQCKPVMSETAVEVVSLEAMQSVLSTSPWHRWWTAADANQLADAWVDESQDEKTSELEKEIERERALANDSNVAGNERPVSTYRMTLPEFTLFLAKLAELWCIKQQAAAAAKAKALAEAREAAEEAHQANNPTNNQPTEHTEESNADSADASKTEETKTSDDPSVSDATAVSQANAVAARGGVNTAGQVIDERRAERDRLEDEAFHRQLEYRLAPFLDQLFPTPTAIAHFKHELDAEQLEAAAREEAARLAQIAAEKAERAAAAKQKKQQDTETKASGAQGKTAKK